MYVFVFKYSEDSYNKIDAIQFDDTYGQLQLMHAHVINVTIKLYIHTLIINCNDIHNH